LADPKTWADLAAGIVTDPNLRAEVFTTAQAILNTPDLQHLFAKGSLAEVPITADLAGRRLYGVIDRLVVGRDHILAVDFKSNRGMPTGPDQVPDGILAQMGAYAEALGQVYPGRRIETAILWTEGPSLMVLDRDIVRNALMSATIP
jgi:ATP-dependent helicase/nuclease subunit A